MPNYQDYNYKLYSRTRNLSALGVGFEPTTSRLTVDRSTAELPQNTQVFYRKQLFLNRQVGGFTGRAVAG